MQKLYCYVDESGQDTEGALFIVSAVVTQDERDMLIALLENIEKKSGKGRIKWAKARPERCLAYIHAVFEATAFQGRSYYGLYEDTLEYVALTIATTAEALNLHSEGEEYRANVLVDGLRDSERNAFAVGLRRRGVRTDKVRGADEQQDALIRLADAICGFMRDALDGKPEYVLLRDKAIQNGYLIQVGE
jgi:hypothetical protein